MKTFEDLQSELGSALALNNTGCTSPHVIVVLPSFGLGETVLSHYAARLPALEHRFLLAMFLLDRIPGCRIIYLSTTPPNAEVTDYYASLIPGERQTDFRNRFRHIGIEDDSPRSVADKLRRHPEMLDLVREAIGGLPGFIEPWNVTDDEVEVATKLGLPINGTTPELWPLGFKSAGRRIFCAASVPIPVGVEDVRTADDVVQAIATIRAQRPAAPGVVIKHDNSASGDGNVVLRFSPSESGEELSRRVHALADWYLRDLASGGVVEELIAGQSFTSPSAQVDIRPGGEVRVISTHEQVLGGADAQVYQGCRFPAESAYAPLLASHASAIGSELARRGVLGRIAVDFAAARDGDQVWNVVALEVNLRKGGTTHPYSVLRHLAPGRYDAEQGNWIADLDGQHRYYEASDNVVDDKWRNLTEGEVIAAVRRAGLQFDPAKGAGVVLHMLSCLAIDGRFGLTAIGRSPEEAADLKNQTRLAVSAIAAG
jgi:PGM1 C-terminal domain